MSEWKQLTLKQAGISLIDCDHRTPVAVSSGIPYLTIPQIKDGHINLSEARFISEEDFEIWTRKAKPQTHDVVVSRRCNPGESAYVSEGMKFALGQNLVILRSDNKIVLYPFLRWLVRSPGWWEEIKKFINVGAIFNSLKCKEILDFQLPIPPIDEQKRIIKILSSVDAKIENLRRQNETLEQIARSLFKHWFIDFEFPNAIGKPYKSSGGAMFTSELGEIPEGWHIFSLDEIADFLNGLAMQKYPPDNESDFLPVIKIRELRAGVTDNTDKASINIPAKYIIDNGDIIFSWSGSLDVVIWNFGKGALNQHLFKVDSDKYPKWFYYYWTLNHLNDFQRTAKSKATTMGHIQRKHLTEALCNVPDSNFLEQANKIFTPILQKNINNAIHIQTLITTRDALLPKLMSGQIRVQE